MSFENVHLYLKAVKEVKYFLGLMSGTSLDGLDMALCSFEKNNDGFSYQMHYFKSVEYPSYWQQKLSEPFSWSALEMVKTDVELAKYWAEIIREEIKNMPFVPDFIGNHGQTIFHNPKLGYTTQIGNAATLSSELGIPVISDFRSQDVAHGGEGAPLVPICDFLLFSDYDACLNLGGIANISIKKAKCAFDISFCNLALNHYALKLGKAYDKNGDFARSGTINKDLLNELNDDSYYKKAHPKSLGKESLKIILEKVDNYTQLTVEDKLATLSEHFACKIAEVINQYKVSKLLTSGGGCFNLFMFDKIKSKLSGEVIVDCLDGLTESKEAIAFAFLAYLRYNEQVNIVSEITGAKKSVSAGCVYL